MLEFDRAKMAMPALLLLALVAPGSGVAASGPQAAASSSLRSPGMSMRSRPLLARLLAQHAGQIRPLASGGAPTVTAATLLTKTLNAAKPPAAPGLKLTFSGQVTYVYFAYVSPGGAQYLEYSHSSPIPYSSPTNQFQGTEDPYASGVLSRYAVPGDWQIDTIYIGGPGGQTSYYGTQLAALFAKPSTIKVSNANKVDDTPPAFSQGQVLTTTVSANGVFQARLDVSDDLSGVTYLEINLGTAGSCESTFGFVVTPPAPIVAAQSYIFATGLYNDLSPGAYQVCGVSFFDGADNTYQVYDAATLSKLFPDGTSVTITQ